MGIVLRHALCGLLAAVSLLTVRTPTRAIAPETATPAVAPVLPGPAPPATPPAPDAISDSSWRTAELLRLVNDERAARGLAPLRRDPELDQAADWRAEDMALRDYFAHIAPDGVTPGDQILATGYRPLMCGENIASGYPSARDVVQAWMASPGHRANILERRFRDIGLAFREAPGTDSGVLWVQEFGEPRPERAHPGRRQARERYVRQPAQLSRAR